MESTVSVKERDLTKLEYGNAAKGHWYGEEDIGDIHSELSDVRHENYDWRDRVKDK